MEETRNGRDAIRTLVTRDSGNAKLGRSAATYRTQASCPRGCAFYDAGCYANGRIFGIARHNGIEDDGTYAAVRALATLPPDRLIRWNVSGDYLGPDGTPDAAYIDATNAAAHGRPRGSVIAYTHAWRQLAPAMFAYTVNASCDGPEDIAEARAAGWNTVVVVPEHGAHAPAVAGSRIVACPQQTRAEVTCASCRLCGRDRNATVAFAAHGPSRRAAAAATASMRATIDDAGRIVMVPA